MHDNIAAAQGTASPSSIAELWKRRVRARGDYEAANAAYRRLCDAAGSVDAFHHTPQESESAGLVEDALARVEQLDNSIMLARVEELDEVAVKASVVDANTFDGEVNDRYAALLVADVLSFIRGAR